MVETIAPVVYGSRRMYRMAVLAHAFGAALAAAAVGATAGLIGATIGAPWGRASIGIVGGLALLFAGRELLGLPVPLPQRRQQVPAWWRTFFGPRVVAFGYGAGLGLGFMTFMGFGTYVIVTAAAGLSGHPLAGALLCVPYGIGRGLAPALAHVWAKDRFPVLDRLEDLGATAIPGVANGCLILVLTATAFWASV